MAWVHLATPTQNAAANAVAALIDAGSAGGTIKVYTGAAPATANTAVSGQTLLGTLTFSTTAFGAAVSGVVTGNAITSDTSAAATGTAAWARVADSDGVTVMDIDVGTSGATLNLATVAIEAGGSIAVTSATFTMPSGV